MPDFKVLVSEGVLSKLLVFVANNINIIVEGMALGLTSFFHEVLERSV